MTVPEEDRKNMRHSSSWPDRATQTVKVRVDPLSRAFTIIPTIREGLQPLLAAKTSWIDEIVLLDRGGSTSVETKRRFLDDTVAIERDGRNELGETFELRTLVPDVMKKSSGREIGDGRTAEGPNSESRLPSSPTRDETPQDRRGDNEGASERSESGFFLADEEHSTLRDKRDDTLRTNFGLEPICESARPSTARNEHTREDSKTNESEQQAALLVETVVEIETSKIARPLDGIEEEEEEEEEEKEKKGGAGVPGLPQQSSPRRQPNPHIRVVDYDYITSFSIQAERSSQHACPKCTSEGLLRERVDPFRSPVSSKKSISGRCQDGKQETVRKYSPRRAEGKMRNSWRRIGASGLIGGARNRERDRYARKRNGGLLCRPAAGDVRKEATLRRHYYPEGGWGYVIVTCSALVHFLGIGLQLAAPGSWHLTAELKFHQPALHSAGKPSVSLFLFYPRLSSLNPFHRTRKQSARRVRAVGPRHDPEVGPLVVDPAKLHERFFSFYESTRKRSRLSIDKLLI
ncbi:unnamed protein product [Xylocopa violacea]|uniref:Uncharacterized protein n=1 Tax=Xylocopa violacea TaxID=135666 RepID=A0ABP1P271_XYLVO